jgi:AbrB family looped-hinge helix DNA binding protein
MAMRPLVRVEAARPVHGMHVPLHQSLKGPARIARFTSGDLVVDGYRFVRRVYERGKITVPKEFRDLLDVEDGDLVEFEIVGVVKKAGAAAPAAPSPGPLSRSSPKSAIVKRSGGVQT